MLGKANRPFRAAVSALVCAVVAGFVLATPATLGAAPKDPPVAAGGEGAKKNDWEDYGRPSVATLLYRRAGSNGRAENVVVSIDPANANFTADHAKTAGGAKIGHNHYQFNYDDTGMPTVAEGNAFFNWSYEGYTPAVEKVAGTDATVTTNCVCFAYHGYKSADAKCNYWIDSGDASKPLRDELNLIFASGANKDKDTIPGDRCDNPSHVWIIVTSPDKCAAEEIKWKNNSSAQYKWVHAKTYNNDGPSSRGDFYTDYAVYNKDARP